MATTNNVAVDTQTHLSLQSRDPGFFGYVPISGIAEFFFVFVPGFVFTSVLPDVGTAVLAFCLFVSLFTKRRFPSRHFSPRVSFHPQ